MKFLCSLRGGPGALRLLDGSHLGRAHLRHHAVLPLLRGEGCAGVAQEPLAPQLSFKFSFISRFKGCIQLHAKAKARQRGHSNLSLT
jgi:hypothetical protein